MTEQNENQKVVVEIFGEEYPITGAGDPAYISQIARIVDSRMHEVAQNTRSRARDKVAILTAMSFASQLLEKSEELDSTQTASTGRLDRLLDGLDKALADQLGKLGAQAVLNLQVQVGQSKYITEVQKIKSAAPDAVFYAGYEVETPYLRKQLVDAGVKVPFMASDGAFLSPTIDEAEGAAEGIYLSNFAPEPRVALQAQWSQWLKAYQDVEYRNPDTYSINGYSAMKVLIEGAKKAGTLEGARVADAIRSLDITTPIGKVAYDPSGDLKEQRIFIFQVKDGAFVQVSQ